MGGAAVAWPALDAPLDFRPRLAAVEMDWTPRTAGSHALRLVVNPNGQVQEPVRLNNQRRLSVEVAP